MRLCTGSALLSRHRKRWRCTWYVALQLALSHADCEPQAQCEEETDVADVANTLVSLGELGGDESLLETSLRRPLQEVHQISETPEMHALIIFYSQEVRRRAVVALAKIYLQGAKYIAAAELCAGTTLVSTNLFIRSLFPSSHLAIEYVIISASYLPPRNLSVDIVGRRQSGGTGNLSAGEEDSAERG